LKSVRRRNQINFPLGNLDSSLKVALALKTRCSGSCSRVSRKRPSRLPWDLPLKQTSTIRHLLRIYGIRSQFAFILPHFMFLFKKAETKGNAEKLPESTA
jgi:hypothetical protein